MLERGEKLDNLVERSNALSAQSKMFYKTAKKVTGLSPSETHADESSLAKLLLPDHVIGLGGLFTHSAYPDPSLRLSWRYAWLG